MGRKVPRHNIDKGLLKKLRNDGLTYREISEYLERECGIKVSLSTISKKFNEINQSERRAKGINVYKEQQILEEQLKTLREQGLTYKKISEKLTRSGKPISESSVRKQIIKIYSKNGKTEPKSKRKRPTTQKMEQITDDELKELRRKGLGTRRIQLYYKEKGIDVSRQWIWIRVKRLEPKQEINPKKKEGVNMKRDKLDDELLKELREQGCTYEEIRSHLEAKGVKVSLNTIRTRVNEIYAKNNSEVSQSRNKKQIDIPQEKLIELVDKGLTYEEIVEHLKQKGIEVSIATISRRITEICRTTQTEFAEPKESNKGNTRKTVPEEELLEFRNQGLTYREIADNYKKQGIEISHETIRQRIKQIEQNKKGKTKRDKTTLIDQILKLRETRNATDAQIEAIAKTYGISLDGTRKNKLLLEEDEIEL